MHLLTHQIIMAVFHFWWHLVCAVSFRFVMKVFFFLTVKHKIITHVTSYAALSHFLLHDAIEGLIATHFYPSHFHNTFPSIFVQTSIFFLLRTISLWMTIFRLHIYTIPYTAPEITTFFSYFYLSLVIVGIFCLRFDHDIRIFKRFRYKPLAYLRSSLFYWVKRKKDSIHVVRAVYFSFPFVLSYY